MGRPPCCDKANVKKGPWTPEEDAKLLAYTSTHGTGNWTNVPQRAGLKRCGKSCRLRYTNYLRPNLKHENFTQEEEDLIVTLHAKLGSRWSLIANQLPGRTDNNVRNYWNTKLSKKLQQRGIDPITHRPIADLMHSIGSSYAHEDVPESSRAGGTKKKKIRKISAWLKAIFTMSTYAAKTAYEGQLENREAVRGAREMAGLPPLPPPRSPPQFLDLPRLSDTSSDDDDQQDVDEDLEETLASFQRRHSQSQRQRQAPSSSQAQGPSLRRSARFTLMTHHGGRAVVSSDDEEVD